MNSNEEEKKKKFSSVIIEYGFLILLAVVIAAGVKILFEPTKVSGISMYPTLEDGDRLALNRFETWFGKVDRNDIVVFKWEAGDRLLVKRVIGVEGDKIKISEDGVFVNNKKLDEKYINPEENMNIDEELELVVPKDSYFVMGDNRNHSSDSRVQEIGFIPEDKILGTVLTRYIPIGFIDENHLD